MVDPERGFLSLARADLAHAPKDTHARGCWQTRVAELRAPAQRDGAGLRSRRPPGLESRDPLLEAKIRDAAQLSGVGDLLADAMDDHAPA
jgi:hypothetical protein